MPPKAKITKDMVIDAAFEIARKIGACSTFFFNLALPVISAMQEAMNMNMEQTKEGFLMKNS